MEIRFQPATINAAEISFVPAATASAAVKLRANQSRTTHRTRGCQLFDCKNSFNAATIFSWQGAVKTSIWQRSSEISTPLFFASAPEQIVADLDVKGRIHEGIFFHRSSSRHESVFIFIEADVDNGLDALACAGGINFSFAQNPERFRAGRHSDAICLKISRVNPGTFNSSPVLAKNPSD